MDCDLNALLEKHKRLIFEERTRLGLLKEHEKQVNDEYEGADAPEVSQENEQGDDLKSPRSCDFEKENRKFDENLPLIEKLDLRSCHGSVGSSNDAFVEKLANSPNPLTVRSDDAKCCGGLGTMFRYGEFSPNNPQFKVSCDPLLGLGEYEQTRKLILQRERDDYKNHVLRKSDLRKRAKTFEETKTSARGSSRAVQTDIQNIHSKLVQYELCSKNPAERELSPQNVGRNQSSAAMHNSYSNRYEPPPRLEPVQPKSILTNKRTSRERLMADLHPSPSAGIMDGFSYQDPVEQMERERIKREVYQADLMHQIEEKRKLQALKEEQERIELELEDRKVKLQMLKMEQEEQCRSRKDQQMRRYNDMYTYHGDASDRAYRNYAYSESGVTSLRNNTKAASKSLSHYSPPVSRRMTHSFNTYSNPTSRYPSSYYENASSWRNTFPRQDSYSRSESLNRYESRGRSNSFNRYDSYGLNRHESLSRIDALKRQDSLPQMHALSLRDEIRTPRRHSATHHEANSTRCSPRSGGCRWDDPLSVPVFKARSPAATDLKNSIAVDSRKSDSLRKLEDKWQIPAVQKNIVSQGDGMREGHTRSVLTQLGAIRMQLQKEQLRMEETLRQRGISQPKAV